MNTGYRKRLTTVRSMIRVRTEEIEMGRKSEWVLGETIFGTERMDACFHCIGMVEDASNKLMRWVIG